jgi:putative pyruvate formate lyase activating enzyme
MITRRQFIKDAVLAGSLLALWPPALSAARGPEPSFVPAYAAAEKEGIFAQRVEAARSLLSACSLCPRQCGVNRLKGETGFCRSPVHPVIYSGQPHFGEEKPLVGRSGSGTVFFSNCNLRCIFCQNWPIAHEGRGTAATPESLAEMMLRLQRQGCHNINLVTPTHVMPAILEAVRMAHHNGLNIPLVYNTSGYEIPEVIALLDGLVDIYLPDMKYGLGESAAAYSAGASDYPEYAKASIFEMNRQVGRLETDDRGIARRGLIIRHLVMPNHAAGTREVVAWIAENLPKDTYVNIMSQYRVEYQAFDHETIARAITVDEYLEAMKWAEEAGLTNLDERAGALRRLYLRRLFQ